MSTKQVNGVIESISFGQGKEGQYGMSAPCWVKVNGESFSCFAKEHNGQYNIQNKKNGEYTTIREGMHVVFDAIQNGDYWNFKPLEVTILASGSGAQPPVQQQPLPQQAPVQQSTPQQEVSLKDQYAMDLCRGMAAAMAFLKFDDEHLPDVGQMEKMAKYYFKGYKK